MALFSKNKYYLNLNLMVIYTPSLVKVIAKELCELNKKNLEGISILFSEREITNVQADIEGPASTPYLGGIFRVKLTFPTNFPAEPPKGRFLTKIFHPNVASNGDICVNTLKRDWKPEYGIEHILLTIKCLLIVPNAESALNEEAGMMLLEHYDQYCNRARMYTDIHASSKGVCLVKMTDQEREKERKKKKKVLKRL